MRLIGQLDSPYVRRVAISLEYFSLAFELEPLSVFNNFKRFQRINPVVKAPTLVCDDGEVIMESTLILQYIESVQSRGDSLWSSNSAVLQHELRAAGLALAVCEKGVQILYEKNLRPEAARHEPWAERVRGQLLAALGELEKEVQNHRTAFRKTRSQATLTTAVTWRFTQTLLADLVPEKNYPGLVDISTRMEALREFKKYPPVGSGVDLNAGAD